MKRTYTIFALLLLLQAPYAQAGWVSKTNFKGAKRWGAAAFSIGTKGYIGTGNNNSNMKDFWAWDQATNLWTQKADFAGAARYQASGFAIGNTGYIGLGAAGSTLPFSPLYKDIWAYDTTANKWTKKNNFGGVIRFGAVAFTVGNKAYVGTGFNDNTAFLNDFWEYDPATDKWTQRKDFPGRARMEAVGFGIGNKGYLGTGGNYASSVDVLKDFWEYDPANDKWTQRADFGGTPRSTGVGFGLASSGCIGLGGNFTNEAYADFWEYNPANDKWTQTANFGGSARWLSVAFAIGNKGYCGTGGEFAPTYNDLWEFTPRTAGIASTDGAATDMTVFPNPTTGIFTINSGMEPIHQVEIYDMTGKRVVRSELDDTVFKTDISGLPSGVYFLKVYTNAGAALHKIVLGR